MEIHDKSYSSLTSYAILLSISKFIGIINLIYVYEIQNRACHDFMAFC